jgi:hypothetical protein
MVHTFAIELLWLFSRAKERHEFPTFPHRYCADQPHQRPVFPKRLFGASSIAQVPFPRATCSSTGHLSLTLDLIALPPSPTSPTPPQAISSTYAVYGKANHAPTCAYHRHYATRCNAGDVRTTHRESTTDPDSRPSYRQPSSARSLCIYISFIAYERAIHRLVFPSSPHRSRTFRLPSWTLIWHLV